MGTNRHLKLKAVFTQDWSDTVIDVTCSIQNVVNHLSSSLNRNYYYYFIHWDYFFLIKCMSEIVTHFSFFCFVLKQLIPVSPWPISMSPSISAPLQLLWDTAGSLNLHHLFTPAAWPLTWWPRPGKSSRRNQSGVYGMSRLLEIWFWRFVLRQYICIIWSIKTHLDDRFRFIIIN